MSLYVVSVVILLSISCTPGSAYYKRSAKEMHKKELTLLPPSGYSAGRLRTLRSQFRRRLQKPTTSAEACHVVSLSLSSPFLPPSVMASFGLESCRRCSSGPCGRHCVQNKLGCFSCRCAHQGFAGRHAMSAGTPKQRQRSMLIGSMFLCSFCLTMQATLL